jgi:hypothetical protein
MDARPANRTRFWRRTGLKSFKKKGTRGGPPDDPGNPTVNFHGERRSNATHASTTDPEARLSRKSHRHEAKLAYQGHVLMENRHGLVMDTCVSQATGLAERETALAMATNLRRGAYNSCPPPRVRGSERSGRSGF